MRTRIYAALVLAGLVAIVIVLVVAAGTAIDDEPEFRDLQEEPEPGIPGFILYANPSGCIIKAAASGLSRETVTCVGQGKGTGFVSWVDADTIGYLSFGPAGPAWTEYDIVIGASRVTGQVAQPVPSTRSKRGDRLEWDDEGNLRLTTVEGTSIPVFASTDGCCPAAFITWSPDGEYVLLGINGELVIVDRGGRTLGSIGKSFGESASWWIEGLGYLPEVQLREAPTDAGKPEQPGRQPVPAY